MSIVLYSYFRSSAAFRVRIALNIKAIDYQIRPIHLVNEGGQQNQSEYMKLNPQGLVPVLQVDEQIISQSSAIIEYLEETYPNPALLPESASDRAYVRSLAQIIACDIHPLNNLRVLKYLQNNFAVNDDAKQAWYHHWIKKGFTSFEQRLRENENNGLFCFGYTPGIADAFLIPQVYNAIRFNVDMQPYPLIKGINDNCMPQTEFANAAPENQPDAE